MQKTTNCEGIFQVFKSPLYRSKYLIATATRTCVACGKPAEAFRDCLTRLEYNTSAICEECQDLFFKNPTQG